MPSYLGTARKDTLHGSSGKDLILGQGNDDTLFGLGGNDALFGGTGNDILVGGGGVDVLSGGRGDDRFRYQMASDSTLSHPDLILDFKGADKIDLADLAPQLSWSATPNAPHGIWTTQQSVLGIPVTSIWIDATGDDGVADMQIKLVGTRASSIAADDFILPVPQFSAPSANPGAGIEENNQVGHVFARGDFGFTDADGDEFLELSVTSFIGAGKLYYGDTLLNDSTLPTTIPVAELDRGQLVYYRNGLTDAGGEASFVFTVKDDRAVGPNVSSPATMHLDLNIDRATLFDQPLNADVLLMASKPGALEQPYSAVFDVNHDTVIGAGDAIYFGALTDASGSFVAFSDPLIERIKESSLTVSPGSTTAEIVTDYLSTRFYDATRSTTAIPTEEFELFPDNQTASFTYQLIDFNRTPTVSALINYTENIVPAPFNEIIDASLNGSSKDALLDLYFA